METKQLTGAQLDAACKRARREVERLARGQRPERRRNSRLPPEQIPGQLAFSEAYSSGNESEAA